MTRWDVERAVLTADLPPLAKYLVLVLLVHADAKTLDTGQYSPSLTALADKTGLNRATVQRHLNRLERDGWVIRERPPVELARSKKARTRYTVHEPTRRTEHLELGAESTQPRRTQHLELGAENSTTRRTEHLRSDQSDQGQIFLQATTRIIEVLKELGGGRGVDQQHAEKVARELLPQAKSNPLRFVETCIRRDPARFLPTPTPPPYKPRPFWEN